MFLNWPTWSSPLSIWWIFLVIVSIFNITIWIVIKYKIDKKIVLDGSDSFLAKTMILLSAGYVFGCAFRSVLPRVDVQRLCLFNTWLSSVLVGRSVATLAELCFATQWAITLYYLAKLTNSQISLRISYFIVPLIFIAECCSWYAVITTNYLGNAIEESIWAGTFLLVAIGFMMIWKKFRGIVRHAIGFLIIGILAYVAFELTIDIPMYITRFQFDIANGVQFLGFYSGLRDISSHWIVSYNMTQWDGQILWMSLYFSLAVWASLALSYFFLIKDSLGKYLKK